MCIRDRSRAYAPIYTNNSTIQATKQLSKKATDLSVVERSGGGSMLWTHWRRSVRDRTMLSAIKLFR